MKIKKFSICTDAVFRGKDVLEAVEGVKAAGFDAIEFWRSSNKDLPALKAKADALGVKCVSFSSKNKPSNLTNPGEHNLFIEGLKETINFAKIMGNKCLVATSGDDTGARRDFQHNAIIKVLKTAVPVLVENNMTLLLEPLNNRVDHPGNYLETSEEGFAILDKVCSPNVKLLFDIYHMQISEGDVVRRMVPRVRQIGHIHTAGSTGRNELDLGELDYIKVLNALADAGYDGYVGFEYFPVSDSLAGLKRMYSYLHG